jgi:hypothetical protein
MLCLRLIVGLQTCISYVMEGFGIVPVWESLLLSYAKRPVHWWWSWSMATAHGMSAPAPSTFLSSKTQSYESNQTLQKREKERNKVLSSCSQGSRRNHTPSGYNGERTLRAVAPGGVMWGGLTLLSHRNVSQGCKAGSDSSPTCRYSNLSVGAARMVCAEVCC